MFSKNKNLTKIKQEIKDKLRTSKKHVEGALINEIHPDILIKYNSVNVIVGKQSFGKTVIALEEIIKISQLNTHHLLIYITKNGDENDRSFQSLKDLLKIPYITVSEEDSESCIQELIDAKNLYYQVKREGLEELMDDTQKYQMFDVLHIEDFERNYLHSIVLFDDISNSKLFSNEENFFSQQIKRCRHTNISYFLLIQGWKGIKPFIKNEITTLMIFPCFNKQQLHYIFNQSASNLSWEEFYQLCLDMVSYRQQNKDAHPFLVVQITDGGETFLRLE